MPDTNLFQTIEQTLTLDYKASPSSYEEFVTLLSNRITLGQDSCGIAFTQQDMHEYAAYKERLLAKKAEDTRPRVGVSRFI